ncbi:MAG: DUF805 domain-containing protein [Sphingomonas sp.]
MSRWETAAPTSGRDSALAAVRRVFREFVGLVDPRGRESRRGMALILTWCITLPLTLFELTRILSEVDPQLMTLGTSAVALTLFSVNTLVALICIVMAVMTMVRRLHDHSMGWNTILIGFIPYVGWAWLGFYLLSRGDIGRNGYGPDPREASPAG